MAWTARELGAFLTGMAGHRHHRAWWLAAHTGVRRSELVGLRWRDIDLDHRRLSITRTIVCVNGQMQAANGKTTNAARTIDLDDATLGVLRCWRDDHRERFGHHDPERGLHIRSDGELINPQTISQCFDRAVAKTTLPRLSLHGLRHTHATLLLQAPACRSRSCPNGSATPPPPSQWRPTSTSCPACRPKPPRSSTASSTRQSITRRGVEGRRWTPRRGPVRRRLRRWLGLRRRGDGHGR